MLNAYIYYMKMVYMKTLVVFTVLTILLSFPYTKASQPLTGKTIVIDAGHGGLDPGSIVDNIKEKDINLAISLYLEKELLRRGAKVILIRKEDYDLSKPHANRRKKSDFDNRIKIINNSHANMYISIHLNYLHNPKYFGPQVFYNDQTNNKELATKIQTFLNKKLNTSKEIKLIPAEIYMFDKLNVAGVLIECGFLSNPNERQKLTTIKYQKELAKYIAQSIQ